MKELKEILEDAQDGRLKKHNQNKVKDLLANDYTAVDHGNVDVYYVQPKGYEWKGQIFSSLRDIPIPLTQAQAALAAGKIKEV